jgi:tRNA pseudouridine38-40 synthase
MRVALKIAYDGRSFYGHQRQPDRRTVEGECITALRAAKIIRNPEEAFFRSASRTDRGVSAVGNVIAFEARLEPQGVLGAFNDKARDVWAWSVAAVPASFHPRHAIDRWYRYVLFENLDDRTLRETGRLFVGTHDFQAFCSEPVFGPLTVDSVLVEREGHRIFIDVRARSFRRGMIRRMIAAMLAVVHGDATSSDVRDGLAGGRHDFGSVSPFPLMLMDVRYALPFHAVLKPKVADEIRRQRIDFALRLAHLEFIQNVTGAPAEDLFGITERRSTRASSDRMRRGSLREAILQKR